MVIVVVVVFFFKQKTAYEMRISDWSSDVCSSDLVLHAGAPLAHEAQQLDPAHAGGLDVLLDPAGVAAEHAEQQLLLGGEVVEHARVGDPDPRGDGGDARAGDRKSTRLNSSH